MEIWEYYKAPIAEGGIQQNLHKENEIVEEVGKEEDRNEFNLVEINKNGNMGEESPPPNSQILMHAYVRPIISNYNSLSTDGLEVRNENHYYRMGRYNSEFLSFDSSFYSFCMPPQSMVLIRNALPSKS